MYSLAKIINVMLFCGGWIDTKNHKILRDFYSMINDVISDETRDEDWNIVSVDYESQDYIRIPTIGSSRSAQYFVKKNHISDALKEEYGISDYVDQEYLLFEDDGRYPCHPADSEYFSRQVSLLADEEDMDLPDISEYAMDEVLQWCRDHNIEIVDDYPRTNSTI